MDFEKWINSKEGKSCNDLSTLKSQPYLRNRLWWAFMAGVEFGENPTISKMQKVINDAHRKIGELRKENELLKKSMSVSAKV